MISDWKYAVIKIIEKIFIASLLYAKQYFICRVWNDGCKGKNIASQEAYCLPGKRKCSDRKQ
jgi:hypothetical protein